MYRESATHSRNKIIRYVNNSLVPAPKTAARIIEPAISNMCGPKTSKGCCPSSPLRMKYNVLVYENIRRWHPTDYGIRLSSNREVHCGECSNGRYCSELAGEYWRYKIPRVKIFSVHRLSLLLRQILLCLKYFIIYL